MKSIAYALIALGLGYLFFNSGVIEPLWQQPLPQLLLGMLEFLILPLSSVLLAAICFLSRKIPRFLATFISTLAITHIFLVGLLVLESLKAVPFGWSQYVPPQAMAIAAALSSLLIYACSYIPVIRSILTIGERYFRSDNQVTLSLGWFGSLRMSEGRLGTIFLSLIIALNLFQVAISVRLNFFSRDMFNALQSKDASAFWYQILLIFSPFAFIFVMSALAEILVSYFLQIRWRAHLNRFYVDHWLGRGLHYEMQLSGGDTDNPDQRIADDLREYVETTFDLSIKLLGQLATLVSFISILWGLSAGFTLPGTDIPVPGLLVWVAVLYALLGTWLIHMIGKPLIGLFYQKERVEADYRFSLARVREYGEQIALLDGQHAETGRLHGRFSAIVDNYIKIAWRQMKITSFSAGFLQLSSVFPYLLVAPYFFIGLVTLGQMQQTVSAFFRVENAFNFFINTYSVLAKYKAVINRLTSFESAMKLAKAEHEDISKAKISADAGQDIALKSVTIRLPNAHVLMENISLDFRKGEATLITGPSGSGKSTLFRTIAGIWPFSSGSILLPKGESLMELPQRPYIPQGTLREVVAYPALINAYSNAQIIAALEAARLAQFTGQLDEEHLWSQTLSLGEQQRLAIARALLAQPDWLFLDEATAALDEKTEAEIYAVLKSKLPNTTIVSIGHRSTLAAFHNRRVDIQKVHDGKVVLNDAVIG